jgi:hypothetical protein
MREALVVRNKSPLSNVQRQLKNGMASFDMLHLSDLISIQLYWFAPSNSSATIQIPIVRRLI